MTPLSIQVPFPVFQDRDGQPLDNGYVWIGEPNLNPQTNPVVAYFDKDLTIPAAQPLRTINGYVSRAGTPAQIYVDGVNFSILVQDSKGTMVYNFPLGSGVDPSASGVLFTGFKGQSGFVSDLAGDDGSDWIGFKQAGAGAVARSGQDKMRETVSVKDFGAVGDGVTDDTAAIQAAVNAAIGKTLYFSPGTYMVNTAPNTMPFPWFGGVSIPSNSNIVLDPGAIVRGIANAESKSFLFSLYGVNNVRIEGGQFIGDREAHTYPNVFNTLADLNSNNYRTKDNYLPDPPVWADGKVAYVYQDTAANNGTYTRTAGTWVRTSATVPNYITHEFGIGINVNNSTDVWIEKCIVKDFTGDSIFIGDTNQGPTPAPATRTRRVYVSNCTLDSSRRQGISVVDGDDIAITGNTFKDIGIRKNLQDGTAPRSGIDVESGSGSKSDNVTITGNVFTNCIGASVIQYDGNNVTISGNTADTGMSYGFGVNTTISGNTLINGIINGNGARIPIAFTYTQSGTLVTATLSSAHGLANGEVGFFDFLDANGFVVYSSSFAVTVVSSTVLRFDTPGFTSASGSGRFKYALNNVAIIGNTLMNGAVNATGNGILIANNILRRGVVFIFGTANDVLIANNQISETDRAITGAAGYTGVKISGNRIWNCTVTGIRVYGTNTVVSDNHVTRCAEGIRIDGGTGVVSGNYVNLSAYPTTPGTAIFNNAGAYWKISNNTVEDHSGTTAISCTRKTLLQNNKVIGWTGFQGVSISTANSDGSVAIGNVIECARTSNSAANAGLGVGANTKFRAIGNVIYGTNAAMVRAIDTSTSTNSRITNNVIEGVINSNASDTLTTNVAY
jgi:hypothetical protein